MLFLLLLSISYLTFFVYLTYSFALAAFFIIHSSFGQIFLIPHAHVFTFSWSLLFYLHQICIFLPTYKYISFVMFMNLSNFTLPARILPVFIFFLFPLSLLEFCISTPLLISLFLRTLCPRSFPLHSFRKKPPNPPRDRATGSDRRGPPRRSPKQVQAAAAAEVTHRTT